jgi:hypothetical protein
VVARFARFLLIHAEANDLGGSSIGRFIGSTFLSRECVGRMSGEWAIKRGKDNEDEDMDGDY